MLLLSALTVHLFWRIIWCSNLILFLCKKQSLYYYSGFFLSRGRADLSEVLPADLYWMAFSWTLSRPARSLFSSWRILRSTSGLAETASNTVHRLRQIWNMAEATVTVLWGVFWLTEWSLPGQPYIIPSGPPHLTSPPSSPPETATGEAGQHWAATNTNHQTDDESWLLTELRFVDKIPGAVQGSDLRSEDILLHQWSKYSDLSIPVD